MESPVVAPEYYTFNDSALGITTDLEYSAVELDRIAQKYPKWTSLPSDECDRLRSNNYSLWILLNYHSNLTSGLPVRCLDHAPQPHLSNTVHAVILSIMFVVSLVGNAMTVYSLTHRHKASTRQFSSSIYSLIFHLSIADLLVTFTCLLGEAAWSYSVSWVADNFTCKLFKFAEVFSLYLSTFVLVLIGLDRFLAVKYPMKTLNTKKRCNRSIISVWILSLIFSSPQFLIFRVGKGPFYEDFYQCVTYGFYTEAWQEQVYTVSSLFLMFILPLVIIIWSYVSTCVALAQSENVFRAEVESGKLFPPDLNRRRLMNKAKTKSMRISVVIVVTFIICWTPYYFMMIVFMFHEPNEKLANDLRNAIFCFGMSNSLINPIIYGAFHLWKPKPSGKLNYSSKEFYLSGKTASLRQKNMSARNGIKRESFPMEGIKEDESSLISPDEHKRSEPDQLQKDFQGELTQSMLSCCRGRFQVPASRHQLTTTARRTHHADAVPRMPKHLLQNEPGSPHSGNDGLVVSFAREAKSTSGKVNLTSVSNHSGSERTSDPTALGCRGDADSKKVSGNIDDFFQLRKYKNEISNRPANTQIEASSKHSWSKVRKIRGNVSFPAPNRLAS